MPTKTYIDLTGLGEFKTKQDEYNLTKFASLSGGKVTAEQLPSYVDDIIEGYAENNEGTITFYSDAEKTQEITGVAGKIYIDLETASKNMYVYDANTGEFANFAANVATSADIDSLFDF